MTDRQKQIKQHIEEADVVISVVQAPDFSAQIWRRHQRRKWLKPLAFAASVSFISFTMWMQHDGLGEPTTIAQNFQLESQLAQLDHVALSDEQSVLMDNWYHQLSQIDQQIEQLGRQAEFEQLWRQRSQLLNQMVAFYHQPYDVVEL